MTGLRMRTAAALVISTMVLACGGGEETPSVAISTTNSNGEASRAAETIAPCDLLTAEEVATVLAGPDEGMAVKTGGSMIEGVDASQCSYSNANNDLLTVIVHVATDNARFSEIEPRRPMSQLYDEVREIEVGDGGWLYGDPTEMKLTASQGDAVIALELMAADAGESGDALIELGNTIANHID
ncbi:MAG: hypothetical protein P8Y29_00220 [Gemmatimonadota bacterium]|jgi:hypothetical protein